MAKIASVVGLTPGPMTGDRWPHEGGEWQGVVAMEPIKGYELSESEGPDPLSYGRSKRDDAALRVAIEDLDPPDLRAFVWVAESRSVTQAAESLGSTKSAVSKAIARVERTLGTRLLERSTRGTKLTIAGEVLYRRGRGWLEDSRAIVHEVRSLERDIRGIVRMAAPPDLGLLLVERVLAPALAANPRLEVELALDYVFIDFFKSNLDVAVRVGRPNDDRVVAKKVGTLRRILVAGPTWLAAHKIRTPADLANTPDALRFAAPHDTERWALTNGRATKITRVGGRFHCTNFRALLAAASAGLGVAQCPDFVAAPLLTSGALVKVLPSWHVPYADVYVLYRSGVARPAAIDTIIDRIARAPLLA